MFSFIRGEGIKKTRKESKGSGRVEKCRKRE
jgi:hypothetical protein